MADDNSSNHHHPTVKVWSPSNPKELIVLNTETGSSTSLIVAEKEHEDCNAWERQALRSLIDIAESRTVASYPLEISKEYRNAVCLCLEEWTNEDSAAASTHQQAAPIELVQLDHTCHTLQLAEIFLPLHEYQSPALVTADTVRYLRNQHSRLPFAMDSIEIRRELQHPYAMDRPCFWENMTVAVLTGRLHLATELLLQLPLIANVLSAMDDDTDERSSHPREEQGRLQQEVWHLVTMFRKAPIPGSPFDNKDDGLSMYDETSSMVNEPEVNFGDVHQSVAYLDADAYLQWESTSAVFSPPGASRALQHWQQTLQQLQFSVLFKHFAPLQDLVSIACGSRNSTLMDNRPWWETVLCQIVYRTPTLKPHDLIDRITALVEGTNDEWIVPILVGQGNVALEEIITNRTTSPLPGALVSVSVSILSMEREPTNISILFSRVHHSAHSGLTSALIGMLWPKTKRRRLNWSAQRPRVSSSTTKTHQMWGCNWRHVGLCCMHCDRTAE